MPVVVVQTAASVNGYADSLSVLVRNGAKRTAPSTWPRALLVDHDVLRGAPDRLTRAGVGDATAAWTAPADWYLACALGLDRAFDGGVLQPVLDTAEGLLTADPATPEALTALVDTLTLGGLAIGATGTTASLSGCEHLVSHLLDMAAMAEGTAHDLHGAQVGVASIVAAALWEVALDEEDLGAFDAWALAPPDDLRARVHASWSGLGPQRPGRGGVLGRRRAEVRDVGRAPQRHGPVLRRLGRARGDPAPLRLCAGGPGRGRCSGGERPLRFADLTPAVDPGGPGGRCAACRSCATASPWPTCCCWPAAGPTSSWSASSIVPPVPEAACKSLIFDEQERRPAAARSRSSRPACGSLSEPAAIDSPRAACEPSPRASRAGRPARPGALRRVAGAASYTHDRVVPHGVLGNRSGWYSSGGSADA